MNIIKKLRRTWLRKQIATCNGLIGIDSKEAAFVWVYSAPYKEWKLRVWCLHHADSGVNFNDFKKLYEWITGE